MSAAAVTAWGLESAHRLPDRPLDDDAFAELPHAVRGSSRAGSPRVGGPRRSLPGHRRPARGSGAPLGGLARPCGSRVERVLLEILDAFEPEPVTILALKGLALAHTSYPDPAARVFGDVDVLVAPGGLHRAAQVLVSTLGGTRAEPELRPGFDDRFGREAMVRVRTIEVDLHRTFVNGAYGSRIRLESLFAAPERITVGGREVPVPAPEHRLLHAAYTSTLSDWPPRLVAYRDLAQVITHDDPTPEAVLAHADAWRAEAVLAAGVTDAWRALRLTDRPPLLEWAERYRSTRRDRVLMAASRGPARGYTSQLTSVIAIPGLRARIAFLRAITWPSREYRDARHLGRFGLLGSGARRAMRK